VTLQATDVIVVTVDPCGTALDRLGVDFLVSRTPLSGSCLDERRSFDFGGSHRYVYSRAG